jgi:hypothetical protein
MYKGQTFVPFSPSWDAFCRKIGYDLLEQDLRSDAAGFFALACDKLRPSFSAMVCRTEDYRDEENGEASVWLSGNRYRGKALSHLKGTKTVIPYVVTCGTGMERLDCGRFEELFVDCWKESLESQALQAALLAGQRFFEDLLSVDRLASVNPGSGPARLWPIEQLGPLFRSLEARVPVDARMTRDAYMLPGKSICGIWFPSDRPYLACAKCDRENCPDRMVRFDGRPSDSNVLPQSS